MGNHILGDHFQVLSLKGRGIIIAKRCVQTLSYTSATSQDVKS